MSEDYEYTKMFYADSDYKFDEEEDDEVFVTTTTSSSTTSEEYRGIIIPSRTRRVSDVIDSFNGSPSPISPNFKRHSFAEFPFSTKKTTNTNYALKESKSESTGINKKLVIHSHPHQMEPNKLSLPSTPGSDQGYGSCLPTPTQMVYKTSRFSFSSTSMIESHQPCANRMDGPPSSLQNDSHRSTGSHPHRRASTRITETDGGNLASETDAQPNVLPKETPTQTVIYHGGSPIEVPMPVAKDAYEYNMNHRRRGRAVIFNHDDFKMDMVPRPGSTTDVKNLECVFSELGFQVSVHNNLNYKEINDELNNLCHEDHSDADCLVVTVLTHGFGERYICANDLPYFVERLWLPFTADKCKTLAGKPKIFFIQACRGTKLDGGVMMKVNFNTQTDSSDNGYKIPSYADFLIAYSTVEGFYSWRHPENGTWFIQCLCQELHESGSKLDLLAIMTRVSRRVAIDMESFNDLYPWQHEQKQVPSINSMLIREVIFKSKKN